MSKFVTDEDGPHIIRVIERKEAGRTPFEEVQNDIKMAIRKSRFQEQVVNYLDKLKKETIVQTIFDQPAAELANPISGQLLR
jgi:parvulin-like peptidyl-prolyl isomerase